MKNLIKIIFWAMVAFVGARVFGGSLCWWIIGVVISKPIIKSMFAIALGLALYILFYALIIAGVVAILIH